MARKKTKKQKKKTAARRKQTKRKVSNQKSSGGVSYSVNIDSLEKSEKKKPTVKTQELFDYDPKLLVGDIAKTVILSIVFFGVEIGLYYWLR